MASFLAAQPGRRDFQKCSHDHILQFDDWYALRHAVKLFIVTFNVKFFCADPFIQNAWNSKVYFYTSIENDHLKKLLPHWADTYLFNCRKYNSFRSLPLTSSAVYIYFPSKFAYSQLLRPPSTFLRFKWTVCILTKNLPVEWQSSEWITYNSCKKWGHSGIKEKKRILRKNVVPAVHYPLDELNAISWQFPITKHGKLTGISNDRSEWT